MDGINLGGLGQGRRHVGQGPVDVGVGVVRSRSRRLHRGHVAKTLSNQKFVLRILTYYTTISRYSPVYRWWKI